MRWVQVRFSGVQGPRVKGLLRRGQQILFSTKTFMGLL